MIGYKSFKIENLLKSFEEYGQENVGCTKINSISFQSLLSDILTENKLLIKYPLVRYQFNLLRSRGFYSDYKKVKIILKHLLNYIFHISSYKKDSIVNINVACTRGQSIIEISSTNNIDASSGSENVVGFYSNGTNFSNKAISKLDIVQSTVEKMEGQIDVSSNLEAGIVISIILPDLNNNYYEEAIMPSAAICSI